MKYDSVINMKNSRCPYFPGREQGSIAINEYLEIKTVYLDLAKKNRGGYPFSH